MASFSINSSKNYKLGVQNVFNIRDKYNLYL